MTPVADADGPLELAGIGARIRRSSNFRVAWQLFRCDGPCRATPRTARQILETVLVVPELQTFLAASLDAHGGPTPLRVEPLHAHCVFGSAAGSFERTLARGCMSDTDGPAGSD